MKKTILSTFLLISVGMYSQCDINGKSSINIIETETYTLNNDNAQCTDCHLWVTIGGNSQLEGDTRKNSVKLKPVSGGRTVLSLSVLTAQGISQCSKNIDVVNNVGKSLSDNAEQKPTDCDINFSGFQEIKYSQAVVSFFPANIQNDYKYTWVVNYANGDQKTSTEKVSQFPLVKENIITSVKLKIISQKCMKDLSKTYDNNFWKFF